MRYWWGFRAVLPASIMASATPAASGRGTHTAVPEDSVVLIRFSHVVNLYPFYMLCCNNIILLLIIKLYLPSEIPQEEVQKMRLADDEATRARYCAPVTWALPSCHRLPANWPPRRHAAQASPNACRYMDKGTMHSYIRFLRLRSWRRPPPSASVRCKSASLPKEQGVQGLRPLF